MNLLLFNCQDSPGLECHLVSLEEILSVPGSTSPAFMARTGIRPAVVPFAHLPDSSLSQSQILRQLLQEAQGISGCRVLLSLEQPGEALLFWDNTAGFPEEIPRRCRELLIRFQRQTGLWLSAGLGPEARTPEQLSGACQKARYNALAFNLFSEPAGVYTEPDASGEVRPYNLSAQEDRLYAAILKGSDAAIQKVVQQLMQELFAPGFFCLRQLNRLELLYHGMRINWMDKLRIRYPQTEQNVTPPAFYFSTGFDCQGRFSQNRFREGLCQDLRQVSRFYCQLSGSQDAGPRFFAQIKEYIDFRYAQPLSQQQIADQFYVSVSYLSHAFKKFYGVGMTQYVNQVRLEKAKELLVHSSLSIGQVARQTGFRDEKYFSRVFRQTVGCPPSQYRAQSEAASPSALSQ